MAVSTTYSSAGKQRSPRHLPLVVEVWSRSTGDYDVAEKLMVYQQRGDHEIWRIDPCERTLTVRRRRPDDASTESTYRGGIVRPESLPSVSIALDELFAS